MKFEFEKASKEQSKLRCAIYGPSGAGKTFTALAIAHGMGGRIAVIDTENKSATKYSNRAEDPIFNFEVMNLIDHSVEAYIKAINVAEKCKIDVLIIDSLSHAWQSILEEVDRASKSKFKNNSYAAWSEGTPLQKKLINTLLRFNGHLFCTMRSKTDYLSEPGKKTPIRVGLSPEQGKGIEYEFDVLMEISPDHIVEIIKDRTGKFQDKSFTKPGKEFGEELVAWLNEGIAAPVPAPIQKAAPGQIAQFNALAESLMIPRAKILEGCRMKGCASLEELDAEYLDFWIEKLKERQTSKPIKPVNAPESSKTYSQILDQEI